MKRSNDTNTTCCLQLHYLFKEDYTNRNNKLFSKDITTVLRHIYIALISNLWIFIANKLL